MFETRKFKIPTLPKLLSEKLLVPAYVHLRAVTAHERALIGL